MKRPVLLLVGVLCFVPSTFAQTAEEKKATIAYLRKLQTKDGGFVARLDEYGLLLLDPDGHIITWNVGAGFISGYRAEEIIGRHFSCLYPPEDVSAGKPERELEAAAAVGRYAVIGERVRKNGSRYPAEVLITPSSTVRLWTGTRIFAAAISKRVARASAAA